MFLFEGIELEVQSTPLDIVTCTFTVLLCLAFIIGLCVFLSRYRRAHCFHVFSPSQGVTKEYVCLHATCSCQNFYNFTTAVPSEVVVMWR